MPSARCTQLVLENADKLYDVYLDFCVEIGLPVTFKKQLGVTDVTYERVLEIGYACMR